ncbi:MAG: hypothetical protein JRD68_16430, partial [Deltaproteobacteria bacterium]|nr:hypothetical protein [Deltaproteobacteria bacterium]
MIKVIGILAIIGAVLFLLDRFFLWIESRGWMYYRRVKPEPGGTSSNILLGLSATLQPQIKHVMTAKNELKIEKKQKIGE